MANIIQKALSKMGKGRYLLDNLKDRKRLKESLDKVNRYHISREEGQAVLFIDNIFHKECYPMLVVVIPYIKDIYDERLLLAIITSKIEHRIEQIPI